MRRLLRKLAKSSFKKDMFKAVSLLHNGMTGETTQAPAPSPRIEQDTARLACRMTGASVQQASAGATTPRSAVDHFSVDEGFEGAAAKDRLPGMPFLALSKITAGEMLRVNVPSVCRLQEPADYCHSNMCPRRSPLGGCGAKHSVGFRPGKPALPVKHRQHSGRSAKVQNGW
jgi:hypothetical protein